MRTFMGYLIYCAILTCILETTHLRQTFFNTCHYCSQIKNEKKEEPKEGSVCNDCAIFSRHNRTRGWRENLATESQSDSPLTPIYCIISRKCGRNSSAIGLTVVKMACYITVRTLIFKTNYWKIYQAQFLYIN